MNPQNREYVWKAGFVLIIILCVFFGIKSLNELTGANVAEKNVIHVTGEGKVLVIPDVAAFTFSVQSESKVVSEAQKAVADKADKAVTFLKTKIGIAEKDIQTTNYNIYPRYIYPPVKTATGEDRTLAGYEVTESITVKLRDVSKSADLLGGIGAIGVNDISGPTFTIDKQADLVKEARDKAIADAKSNAQKLANALGVTLVRIVDYSESGNAPGPIMYGKAAYGMGGGAEAAAPLPVGQNEINSQVNITYQIR